MRHLAILLVLTLAAVGCSHSTDTIAIGASMTGTVRIYNTNTAQYDSARDGVSVTIQGTAFHATTDAQGKWTIDDLAPGIYTLVFTKSGYDTAIVSNHKFSGAGVDFIDPVTIHFLASGTITLDSISMHQAQFANDTDLVLYGSSNDPASSMVQIFASASNGTDASWKLVWNEQENRHLPQGPFAAKMTQAFVKDILFDDVNAGGTVYFKAVSKPQFGQESVSNVFQATLAPDVLTIDSIALMPLFQRTQLDSVVIFGRFSVNEYTLALHASTDPSDSLGTAVPYPELTRSGRRFKLTSISESLRAALKHDSTSFNAWFYVTRNNSGHSYQPRSNTVSALIPSGW